MQTSVLVCCTVTCLLLANGMSVVSAVKRQQTAGTERECSSLLTPGCTSGAKTSQDVTDAEVHIRVHVPPGFLRYKPEVYVNRERPVVVSNTVQPNGLEVDKYGMYWKWIDWKWIKPSRSYIIQLTINIAVAI